LIDPLRMSIIRIPRDEGWLVLGGLAALDYISQGVHDLHLRDVVFETN
jgi:hypothetical protein